MVWARGQPFNMTWGAGSAPWNPRAPRARTESTAARRGAAQGRRSRGAVSAFQKVSTVQRKYIDTSVAMFTAAPAAGQVTLLNAATQGTGNSGRVGRVSVMKSVLFRFALSITNGATSSSPHVRVIIVYDKETNGVAPTAATILQIDNVIAPMNLENASRFIVLCDTEVIPSMASPANGTPNAAQYSYRCFKNCRLQLEWNQTNGGTVADINYGAIFALTYCVNNGANQPTIYDQSSYARIRFTDA